LRPAASIFSYSQPVIKNITVVARLQGGYSGGQSKLLYNFGGMDNNIVTRVDTSVHLGQDAPFAFQTLVTPFRGYEQNSIYGSHYGLLNLDLYFPLFRGLIPLRTSFSSLKNLQVGLFTDIARTGGATGLPAASSQLSSFGFSVRTMLAGYPLRFDMAWPGDFNKTPVWYLSLSLK
jgi:outer membrane protein assembly factor BamA